MNAGSLFSGIGGLDYGLHQAGHTHVFFCESDAYRRDVLRARWPGVPIYEDVRELGRGLVGRERRSDDAGEARLERRDDVGLLCGGFPCQDVSVAGRRAGLDGARSGLFHEFARIADALRPQWLLVENVPGLLSSNGGRDFGVVVGTLADIGYGVAWRVLDSRFFGVPQRRRRVFIIGALANGDPRAAAERAGEILAVGQGCKRHPKTRGEAGPDVAYALADGSGNRTGSGRDGQDTLIAAPLTSGGHPNSNMPGRCKEDDENLVAVHMLQDPISDENVTPAWGKGSKNGTASIAVNQGTGVRRLTPTECERLQALPDNWTQLGGTPDSRRYSALGDAVTSSVAFWIGRRLAA